MGVNGRLIAFIGSPCLPWCIYFHRFAFLLRPASSGATGTRGQLMRPAGKRDTYVCRCHRPDDLELKGHWCVASPLSGLFVCCFPIPPFPHSPLRSPPDRRAQPQSRILFAAQTVPVFPCVSCVLARPRANIDNVGSGFSTGPGLETHQRASHRIRSWRALWSPTIPAWSPSHSP
jgi:hypothetical protein